MEQRLIPRRLEICDPFVALTFVGGGWGEGVIVNVGGKFILVFDCCSVPRGRTSSVKTLELVERISKAGSRPDVRVLLLTHPHLDHFAGMHRVIANYRDQLWRCCIFQGTTEYELARLFEMQTAELSLGRSTYRYFKKFGQILKAYKAELSRNQRLAVCDRSVILAIDLMIGSAIIPFSVTCLSPSDDDSRQFLSEARFANFVELAASRKGRLAQVCNRVSVVTRIDFGSCRIVLGGDAEEDVWLQICEKYSREELQCNVFKVSHHGSSNGCPDFLLEMIAKDRGEQSSVAVIAPSILHGLPDEDVPVKLAKYFDEVLLTTTPKDAQASEESRIRVHFPAARKIRPLPRCSEYHKTVVFDAEGKRHLDRMPPWVYT